MKQNPVFLTTSISQQYDNQPLVSVLIPACNSARYIGKAIDSILAQNYPNIEIIVVDDGSTDETGSVIAAAKAAMPTKQGISGQAGNDEIVRYFYKEHSGISATRNFALEKANGEYIAWCDADDYWMAGKLAVQMQYFAENPDCQIVFTRYKNFIDNEELINTPKVTNELESEKTLKFLISTSLCRKRIFECLGSFREDLQCSEDTEFDYRMLIAGVDAKHCIDEIYYCRRLHDNNITLVCDNGIFEISPEYIAQTIRRYTLPDMKKKLLPKVNVAFCFDKFFLKYAVTTITSLVYNNKGKCCYGIFCVVDTTIELADKNRLENIVKRFSPCSTLYFISADSSFDCSKTRHFTKAIYFRMLLPELLPDIDKIIYLDTDLVVCDALLDLYNTDIGDNLLAGIYDNCVWRIKWVIYEHFHLSNGLKLNRTEYINSGVLLMNLYKLREVNLKKTWIDLSINKNLLMPDQDILNYSCAGQKFILPLKYNYNPLYLQGFQKLAGESIISPQDLEEAKTAAVIYHFYGEKKPWNSNCPAADIWRKYAEIAEQHLLPQ